MTSARRPSACADGLRIRFAGKAASATGQASVELVALIPVAVTVVLALMQVLAAGAARERAGHAAEAGAVALLQGADPRRAVREALPGWSPHRLRVRIDGDDVAVRVRPITLVPGLAALLTSTVHAHAGGGA